MYTEVEERLSSVEAALAQFIVQTNRGFHILQKDMIEFKNEMREFKNEMSEFKNEMSEFKEEVRTDQKKRAKEWGDLANKMGTLVEDLIAPAVRPVLSKYFSEEIDYIAVNVKKKDKAKNLMGEFDVIATSASFVFLVSTKSRPKKEHLNELGDDIIPRFQALFPEFAQKQLVPVFASLRFEEPVAKLATSKRIYLLAYREWEYMDLLNFDTLSA
jgi:hypothetical protein